MGKMEVKDVLMGFGWVLEAPKDLAVKIVEIFNDVIGDLEHDGVIEEATVDCLEELHDGSSFGEVGAREFEQTLAWFNAAGDLLELYCSCCGNPGGNFG